MAFSERTIRLYFGILVFLAGIAGSSFLLWTVVSGERLTALVAEAKESRDAQGTAKYQIYLEYHFEENTFHRWTSSPFLALKKVERGDSLRLCCRPHDPSRCWPVNDIYCLLALCLIVSVSGWASIRVYRR